MLTPKPKCANCGTELILALGNPLSYKQSALFYICPNAKAHKTEDNKPMVYCSKNCDTPKPQAKEATAIVNQ